LINIKPKLQNIKKQQHMYVNNTNMLLLIYNVYNYDYSFGENKI